mmetsp:Transcript_20613/g.57208  ORF Transcript_20613/g.57208 Transcript_20613/m.57208 type:complete len:263 (-) Transcript_20613:531-1319(-)
MFLVVCMRVYMGGGRGGEPHRHGGAEARARRVSVGGGDIPYPGVGVQDCQLIARRPAYQATEDVKLAAILGGGGSVVTPCHGQHSSHVAGCEPERAGEGPLPAGHLLLPLSTQHHAGELLIRQGGGRHHHHVDQGHAVAATGKAAKRNQHWLFTSGRAAAREAVAVADSGHRGGTLPGWHQRPRRLCLRHRQKAHIVLDAVGRPAPKEHGAITVRSKAVALPWAGPSGPRLELHTFPRNNLEVVLLVKALVELPPAASLGRE